MEILNQKVLLNIVVNQLSIFGSLKKLEKETIHVSLDIALHKTQKILDTYKNIPKTFNLMQTHHSSVFYYKLAQTIFQNKDNLVVCEKLYLLNRMLNGLDLFYKIDMPETFLLGHSLGTVFSHSTYGNYLVVFQNVTIAFQDGAYPVLGEKVIIYPNSVISGNTKIGNNSVIGAGTRLINKMIPDNSIAYEKDGKLLIKPNDRDEIRKYFDIH